MHPVDFLPAQYRRSHARRRSTPWRVVVVATFGALVVVASVGQHQRRVDVDTEMASLATKYAEAAAVILRWQTMQTDMDAARAEAELYTYLRHPWPRTQVFQAVLISRPDGVAFECLEISHRESDVAVGRSQPTADEVKAKEERLARLPAAARDLATLRDECNRRRTLVTITGTTTDTGLLHAYLAQLRKADLISRVDLPQIGAEDEDDGQRLRFKVTLLIKPGYGQPGGPDMPVRHSPSSGDITAPERAKTELVTKVLP